MSRRPFAKLARAVKKAFRGLNKDTQAIIDEEYHPEEAPLIDAYSFSLDCRTLASLVAAFRHSPGLWERFQARCCPGPLGRRRLLCRLALIAGHLQQGILEQEALLRDPECPARFKGLARHHIAEFHQQLRGLMENWAAEFDDVRRGVEDQTGLPLADNLLLMGLSQTLGEDARLFGLFREAVCCES